MTGYTVHTGSSDKFAAGWDQIFSGQAKPAKKKGAAKKDSGSAKAAKAESGKKSKKK